ncbi:MAG: xanthine dehydrogenase FAD-binding subunit XdhB [Peptostreptococcaceae bacterium]|jgi:xanthine dehydrogenase|nr:xanthine dehydrogenase FAD-binding subunit XdhB [Peptostreptococcaceae bacterium]
MYDIKKIYEPKDIDEAVKFLAEDDEAIIINGGSDVLIKNREGQLTNIPFVSIYNLKELKDIYIDDKESIIIGSGVSFTNIEKNSIVQEHIDFLSYAVGQVGGPQIRNIGTMGGNICNGVPSADSCTSVMALNAYLHLKSVRGTRVVPVSEFYVGAGKTVRERDEILTHFEIRKEEYKGYKGNYIKYAMRNAMDIATLGCCIMTKLSEDKKTLEDIKITYGVAAPTPIRSPKLEEKLRGQKVDENLIKIIDENYKEDVNPRDSWRASKDFRLHIIREMARRNINQSIVKGGGQSVYSC